MVSSEGWANGSVMVMVLTEEQAVVFLAGQMVAHDHGEQVHHLVDFLLAHARRQRTEQAVLAELLEKSDE